MEYGQKLAETLAWLRPRLDKEPDWAPDVALVLGSGMDGVAAAIEDAVEIPYGNIPHFCTSGMRAHKGVLIVGTLGSTRVVCMQGRVHLYEGYTPSEIIYPLLTMHALGATRLIATNASGGIRPDLTSGSVVAVTDHINLTGETAFTLSEERSISGGTVFTDMVDAYSPALIEQAHRAADACSIALEEGVYIGTHGPQFETPAEIRAFRSWGADIVGMSTILEVIAARTVGMEVLCLSGVVNPAAGLSAEKLTHEAIAAAMHEASTKISAIIGYLLQ